MGGGIVIGGRVYRGATGAAAELGHTLVSVDMRSAPFAHTDHFPQPGSLEAYASGSALNELAREHGLQPGHVIECAREGMCSARARSSCLDAASVWVSRMRSTRSTLI